VTRAIFFDLDDTLFDHSGAARDALAVVQRETPAFQSWTFDDFDRRHRVVLETLHVDVLAGKWTVEAARVERFRQLLSSAGTEETRESVLDTLSWQYRGAYELAWRLVPGALELVTEARHAGWLVIIVTNNIVREQRLKLERSGLAPFVDALVTSEEVGASKPDPRIMQKALDVSGVLAECAVVFGDSWTTDIAGAQAAGLRAVWFNRWAGESPRDWRGPRIPEVRSLEPAGAVLRILEAGS
jgi:HAD superfamily hydrolase (TIGR01509 family)